MEIINKLLKTAQAEVGTKENPSGSNKVKYNTAYYGREVSGSAYPWCCAFIWWLFRECGASHLFYDGKKTASCTTLMNYYKKKGQTINKPKAGALVFYNWGKGTTAKHIGIVKKVNSDGSFVAIEGNTAVGNDSNGGEVMERSRNKSQTIAFAFPYSSEKAATTLPKIEPAEEFSKSIAKTYTVTASALNMRRGAGTTKGIVKVLPRGAKVTNYGYYTKYGATMWLLVKDSEGDAGYCSKKYLA